MALRKLISVAEIAALCGLPESRVILKLKYGGIPVTLASSRVALADAERIFPSIREAAPEAARAAPRAASSTMTVAEIADRYGESVADVLQVLRDFGSSAYSRSSPVTYALIRATFDHTLESPESAPIELFPPGTCPGCGANAVAQGQPLCGPCGVRLAAPTATLSGSSRTGDVSAALVRRWIGACANHDPSLYYSLLLDIAAERPDLWCRVCVEPVHMERMRGEYSASHLCAQSCRYAHGDRCKCSCGGVNHGAGFSLN